MAGPAHRDGVTLIFGEQQVAVDTVLGIFYPRQTPEWGGMLHRVPTRLLSDMHGEADVRLRLSNGEELRIHPLDALHADEEEYASVPFSGDEKPPI
jgi:hypothetical protein